MVFRRCLPAVLIVLPGLVSAVPWDFADPADPAQDNMVMTATLTSTLLVTGSQAASTFYAADPDGSATATSSLSSPPADTLALSSSAPDPGATTSTSHQAIFFLPPSAAGPPAVSASSAAQASYSSIETSSMSLTATQTPYPTTTPPVSQSATDVQENASPSSSAAPTTSTVTPLVMAYYPDWAASTFPPEKIDFGRLNWIDFAFAVPDQNFNLTWDGSDEAPDLLQRLVTVAHDSGAKVKLSVGGWTGSQYFSPAVADAESRSVFASNIRAFYDTFDLDGIDIDWEYPGQAGNDGNSVSPDDTANFLSFLQLLRQTLPATAKMSAAVQTVPFAGADGDPLADVSAFAQVLDWVLIMNYDAWGSSPTPGPNAPLSDGCHNSTQPSANAAAAVRAWTAAGFPADQLVLGVPAYGYISQSSAMSLRQRSASGTLSAPRKHRRHLRNRHRARSSFLSWAGAADVGGGALNSGATSEDVSDGASGDGSEGAGAAGTPPITAANEDGSPADGQVQFRGLVAQGILQYSPQEPYEGGAEDASAMEGSAAPTRYLANGKEIDSLYDGWSGFTREWDDCSSTPFLRSASADQVVTYDDPLSLGMKAAFAQGVGLLGVNMFDISGDTDQWDLTDAVRKGLGLD